MIHRYQLRGYNIVLDVGSGAVHLFDDLSYHMLGYLTPPLSDEVPDELFAKLSDFGTPDDIRDSYAEILELSRRGELFSEDGYEAYERMLGHVTHQSDVLTYRTRLQSPLRLLLRLNR